jgi:hypothetical protein
MATFFAEHLLGEAEPSFEANTATGEAETGVPEPEGADPPPDAPVEAGE